MKINTNKLNLTLPQNLEMNERERFTVSIFDHLIKYVSNIGSKTMTHTLVFMNNIKAAGLCFPSPCTIIAISREFINSSSVSDYDIMDTILHELTHAYVGCYHGHDQVWQKANLLLGGSGKVYCCDFTENEHYKYILKCNNGCIARRHRLRKSFWDNRLCDHHQLKINVIKNK